MTAKRPDDIVEYVTEFFHGNQVKVELWFTLENPLLGHISPDDMIRLGRIDKLRQFIEYAKEMNKADPSGS